MTVFRQFLVLGALVLSLTGAILAWAAPSLPPLVLPVILTLVPLTLGTLALVRPGRQPAPAPGPGASLLDHLDTALAAVGRDLRLVDGGNAAFRRAFPAAEVGAWALETVFASASATLKSEVAEAVDLAFAVPGTTDTMLGQLLTDREVVVLGQGPADVRYFELSLSVVREGGEAAAVVLLFRDVTLGRLFRDEEARHRQALEDQYGRIRQIVVQDRAAVRAFVRDLHRTADLVADEVRAWAEGSADPAAVGRAAGLTGQLKATAQTLGFDACADRARALEATLREVEAEGLTLDRHLGAVGQYEALEAERTLFRKMVGDLAVDLEAQLRQQVFQAARTQGKEAVFEFSSPDLRLAGDRLHHLAEGLLPLVENAVVHGLEGPAARQGLGKAPRGRVQVTLTPQDKALVVKVTDDGAGFDWDRLRSRLQDQGLAPGSAATADLIRALFQPATGAGRGLPAARRHLIQGLGGQVTLQNSPGAGATLQFVVPWEAKEPRP